MRLMVGIAVATTLLTGCGTAEAVTPDATKPAHCIAAFNWGAFWFATNTPQHAPDRPRIAEMIGHARYELEKVKAAGGSVSLAETEGKQLTIAYAKDGDQLTNLMMECSLAHAHDPEFRKQWPELLAWANEVASSYPTHP